MARSNKFLCHQCNVERYFSTASRSRSPPQSWRWRTQCGSTRPLDTGWKDSWENALNVSTHSTYQIIDLYGFFATDANTERYFSTAYGCHPPWTWQRRTQCCGTASTTYWVKNQLRKCIERKYTLLTMDLYIKTRSGFYCLKPTFLHFCPGSSCIVSSRVFFFSVTTITHIFQHRIRKPKSSSELTVENAAWWHRIH